MAHAQTPYLTKDVHDHQSQRDVGLPVSFKTCGRFIRNSRLDTGFSNPLNFSKNHSTVDQTHHHHHLKNANTSYNGDWGTETSKHCEN